MTTIIGISGSLRRASFNTALLRAAQQVTPEGINLEIASIRGIPLYDGDMEATSGIPDVVKELKDRIASSGGLLLVTPEYNNSIPGVFKNAIDWMTRPASDISQVFRDRPVAVMGATTGRGATILAQAAWLPVLRALGTKPWFGPRFTIREVNRLIDESGQLLDDHLQMQLRTFIEGFAKFIRSDL